MSACAVMQVRDETDISFFSTPSGGFSPRSLVRGSSFRRLTAFRARGPGGPSSVA
jgi:hypothetical protein